MAVRNLRLILLVTVIVSLVGITASAQSFRVQCPTSTITHPAPNNDNEPAYTGPTTLAPNGSDFQAPTANVNGAIKCQQISGGDGYATMADGTQTYMFSFGPLSGLADIAKGQPGTESPSVFNQVYSGPNLLPGDPATTGAGFAYNGAIGQIVDLDANLAITSITTATTANMDGTYTVTVQTGAFQGLVPGVTVNIAQVVPDAYNGTFVVQQVSNDPGNPPNTPPTTTFTYNVPATLADGKGGIASPIDGHVDVRQIMDIGVMNGNIPAPLMAIDEDDEFFLTLSNVGMVMRPDLFEQHTVHFHGYPNASAFYDGVPDASVAINIGASFTYYYLAPDAGTYFFHCHITPPEHLQMGMVGQLYVRPRQNRVPSSMTVYQGLQAQELDLRTRCDARTDILCSNPLPAGGDNNFKGTFDTTKQMFAYNDGDGTTRYDVEYPLQIHGFDPNFHFVGMTFNPEGFADMKDKYFLLNGRSYPDTVTAGPIATQSTDGSNHYAQPLDSIITIPAGKRALLRISDLDVTEYQTLASLGIPMQVIGYNAKLLRDQAGINLYYTTNSITLAGGESLDVILDTTGIPTGTYYLYTPNLDHLSNDAENFGGLMTEVRVQ